MSNSPTIAVIGAGALGGFFAAQASFAGHKVVLCARSPLYGLTLESGGQTHRVAVAIETSPTAVGPVPWIFLATKAQDTEGAALWLARLARPGTQIAVIQNGLDHERRVASLAPEAIVLPALAYTNVERVSPGHLRHHFGRRVIVPAGTAGADFAGLFVGTGLQVVEEPDFNTALWTKILSNIAANALTALTMRRNLVLREPDMLELAGQLLAEAVLVAQAEGAALGPADVQTFLRAYAAQEDGTPAITSMLQDRLAGRRMEHDYINGEVVRRAEHHGIDVPLNRAVLTLLAALDPAGISAGSKPV